MDGSKATPEEIRDDPFPKKMRVLFETLEQIFDSKHRIEKKTGPIRSPAYSSFLKYRDHFSGRINPDLHKALFRKLYNNNIDAILGGKDDWIKDLNKRIIITAVAAEKRDGDDSKKKKAHVAAEIQLTVFYLAADSLPPSIATELKEELRDNVYRIIYCLLQEDFIRNRPSMKEVDVDAKKRELNVILSRCRSVPVKAPNIPMGKGGNMGLLNMISSLAKQDDINKAFARGDTRGIVQALAQSVETIAQETGITDQKINPEVINKFSDGAEKFMTNLQSGNGDLNLAKLAADTLGDINFNELMKGNVGGSAATVPKTGTSDSVKPETVPAAKPETVPAKPETVPAKAETVPAAASTKIDDQPE